MKPLAEKQLPSENADAPSRIVCHFSCGAASAVATKLTLASEPAARVEILNAFIENEHPDNRRFLDDCERWFQHPVTRLSDHKYGANVHEVWRRERFMKSLFGAPCSMLLKREVIEAACFPNDIHVFGYTAEELKSRKGVRRLLDVGARMPLIDRGLSHADCLAIIERAEIELPAMYRLGYNNANCIGCCKGGEGYWNKIRRDFPEVFAQVVQIQEAIGPGAYLFRNRKTGSRYGLKDLDPKAGRHTTELPACSFVCADAEEEFQV